MRNRIFETTGSSYLVSSFRVSDDIEKFLKRIADEYCWGNVTQAMRIITEYAHNHEKEIREFTKTLIAEWKRK